MFEMATGELPFPPCKKLFDAIKHIGNTGDITMGEELGLSLELRDFIQHW
jgi:hypothetical protein